MRRILAIAVTMLATTAPRAAEDGATQAASTVAAAMARGYGATCSLEMQPVASGGYYPCLDIGPYRFVAEYGRTRGFVLVEGQPPFPVMVSDGAGARFEYQGGWVTDLPARVSQWWTAQGTPTVTNDPEAARAAADGAVAAYLQSLEPQVAPAAPPAPVAPAQQAPQVIYVMPPNYTPSQPAQMQPGVPSDQIPITGVPFPQMGQQPATGLVPGPNGVLLAPGVVAYPPPQ